MKYTCGTCGKQLNGYRSTGTCRTCLHDAVQARQVEFNRLYNSGLSAERACDAMGMRRTAAQSYMERGVASGLLHKRGVQSLGRAAKYGSLIRTFADLDHDSAMTIRCNIRPGETLADTLVRMALS